MIGYTRKLALGALMLVLLSATLGPGVATADTAPPTHTVTWLAAGDSFASGAGLEHTTKPCAQGTGTGGATAKTWAVVAHDVLTGQKATTQLSFDSPRIVACTGAISNEFFHAYKKSAAQWTRSMGRFDLVTFSFGGDDIGFSSIVKHCVTIGCPSDADVRQKIRLLGTTGLTIGGKLIPPYPAFLKHVAKAAVTKGGNVVVMGYPEVVEDPTVSKTFGGGCEGFTEGGTNEVRGWAGDLNATIGAAVTQANALSAADRNDVHFTFIDPVTGQGTDGISPSDPYLFEPTSGTRHELCSRGGNAWLNGLLPGHLTTRSFHPTQNGETAMGDLAAEVIPLLSWPWAPTWRQIDNLPTSTNSDYPSLVSCANGPFCVIVAGATAEDWAGAAWVQMPDAPGSLDGISCTAATFCMGVYDTSSVAANPSATTGTFTSYSTIWNGSAWSQPAQFDSFSGSTAEPYGVVQTVSCTSPHFCMAVGGDFGSTIWNGSTWRHVAGQTTGTDGGTALSCTSPTFCMATPAAPQTIIWNGSAWGPGTQSVPGPTDWFSNVACASSTQCYATATPNASGGEEPYSFDGTSWTAGATNDTPDTDALSCASTTYCAWGASALGGVSTLEDGKWSPPLALQINANSSNFWISCTTTFCLAVIGTSTYLFSTTELGTALVTSAAPARLPSLDIPLGPYNGIEPTEIYFSGDATNEVTDITWSSWTETGATGQGTWTYLSCVPDCADSPGVPYPATITLSDPVNGIFTSAVETTQGPYGFTSDDAYSAAASGSSWPTDASGGQLSSQ